MQRCLLTGLLFFLFHTIPAQEKRSFTHADTLRGSITPQRAWWDVTFYDLHVQFDPADHSIKGYNSITYKVLQVAGEMQIDLMQPLEVDSMVQNGQPLSYRRDGNVFFAILQKPQVSGEYNTITVYYHGKPQVAKHPPWDGGIVWSKDSLGNVWIASACQGVGASIWWPNKDIQADEPDSQRIAITVPDTLMDISNGRLRSTTNNHDGTVTYEWFVENPINNYDVAVNIGKYAHFSDTYKGLDGELTLDFWPLPYHLDAARTQFRQVKLMLQCFEYWMGPYPWYKDGYKLVETPYLGMEHQSCIGYGNHYDNGYLGRDLSGTGQGLKWDFIIVHESAHEWFGNNITTRDLADMWVHESFANYAECLFVECRYGKKAGAEYVIGCRKNVSNDEPIIAPYGVNQEGSGDMYYKGGNMLHTIRQIVNDDEKWRGILRGLNKTFRHQTVDGRQVEKYISRPSEIDLSKVFDEYLRTTMIPVLEYRISGNTLSYRWSKVVKGFRMPIKVTLADDEYSFITPDENWKSIKISLSSPRKFKVDENFYVAVRKMRK